QTRRRRPPDGPHPLSLARGLFPRALRHRGEDQPVADGDGAAAIHAGTRRVGGMGRRQAIRRATLARLVSAARLRRALSQFVSEKPRGRGRLDGAAHADRLSARLRHCAVPTRPAAASGDAGGAAVLDVVPDPRLRLDQHPAARRAAQRRADAAAPDRCACCVARLRHRDLYRRRLFVSAVHGAAALRVARKDRSEPDRGRRRSRLSALEVVLARDVSVVMARSRRRGAALLHPDHRRIRHSRSARRLALADDRADAVDRVLLQPRLACRLGDRGGAARPAADPDPVLRTPAEARHRRGAVMQRTSAFNVVSVALGLAFLYLPIAILVIYSFNASRLVTVWGGWSLEWYRELLRDQAILDAAWMSLRIGALSATAATVLGTLAAVALTRAGRFRGRLLFSGMVYAPLVMPEVITGLSLLLLFVAANVD